MARSSRYLSGDTSKAIQVTPQLKDYVFGNKLGQGSYGVVYKACRSGSRGTDQVAIKCIFKARLSSSSCDNLINEISILKNISCDFIVSLLDFNWDSAYIYLIFEYCSLGDLDTFLKSRPSLRLDEASVRYFLQQMSSALQCLHSSNVCHLDLKPKNILVSCKNIFYTPKEPYYVILKLADFGFAQCITEQENHQFTDLRGTPLYMAPEIVCRTHYDARADLWSIGIIMYQLLTGTTPFSSCKSLKSLIECIKLQSIRFPRSIKLSDQCHDLLVRLLKKDPEARISFEDFFSHPFLRLEYIPSTDSYKHGCDLLSEAINKDKQGQVNEALNVYFDALDYLVPIYKFGMPLNEQTKSLAKSLTRNSLRNKLHQYIERMETLRKCASLSLEDEKAISKAYDICFEADDLLENGQASRALKLYEKSLRILLEKSSKLKGDSERKKELASHIALWLSRAEEAKSLVAKEEKRTGANESDGLVTLKQRRLKRVDRSRPKAASAFEFSHAAQDCRVQ